VLLFPGQEQFNGPKATVPFDAYYKVFDVSMLVDGGRAVVETVWHGSNERYANVDQMDPEEQRGYYRDAVSIWRREMGLVLDYLASRGDIDAEKAIFLGVSYGATFPIPSAVMEERFQTFVLLYGGLVQPQETAPVSALKNFLPRLKKPVFMLNGRLDSIFPPECSQALFDLLGTRAADKRLDMLDAGHGYWTHREMLMIVDWLDERLGRSGIH
jgi:dienelactone hydrolase